MSDYESNDLAGAAHLATDYGYDGPTLAEAERDMHEHDNGVCCECGDSHCWCVCPIFEGVTE